ncbi:MAG: glycosyltransferase family 39 protein [Oscillochloridaceae bacterium]|nr:glycosyltransferase family 39 protein [Chloroflexaceae bacterium]MDW8390311.1 glycosyltransferase family 39 protein [Oscillochloridaceae bacterium]
MPGVSLGALIVGGLMAASSALHLVNLSSIGYANEYYTAAVNAMLQSWSNFFFVAAEPGGSVTVDKPPLGLWVEALFAYFLGVSGFSVILPNVLAGALSIGVLYQMAKTHMGELAGVTAALTLAITPVFIATNRNNTMDGMLVFTLLLAAWACLHATESGDARWLLLGAFLVGLGFNIKMLQAFLPLPALYALYFFGARGTWLRKSLHLGAATLLLVAVSLAWAVAVDLTPPEKRPYIGSSGNNTVMGLIFGHNAAARLGAVIDARNAAPSDASPARFPYPDAPPPLNATQGRNGQADPSVNPEIRPQELVGQFRELPPAALEACFGRTWGAPCSFIQPNGQMIGGTCITPPAIAELVCAPEARPPQNGQAANGRIGNVPFRDETGLPGVFRFFVAPLSKQMSWLLPFALISMALALFGAPIRLPVRSGVHKGLILWGGWLLVCLIFFSATSGIFHAYYTIMLAPPLGGLVGIGFAQLYRWNTGMPRAIAGLILVVLITPGFQLFAASQYNERSWWMFGTVLLLGAGIFFMPLSRRAAYGLILSAMLVIPAYWSVMTVLHSPDNRLPTAYMGRGHQGAFPARPGPDVALMDFLQANTGDVRYLVATPSAQQGAPYVIATGRPVLYIGGFSGQDNVATARDLATLVARDELRYVLYGRGKDSKPDITAWLASSCAVVKEVSPAQDGPGQEGLALYECRR